MTVDAPQQPAQYLVFLSYVVIKPERRCGIGDLALVNH